MLKMHIVQSCPKVMYTFILNFHKAVAVTPFRNYSYCKLENTTKNFPKISNKYLNNFTPQSHFRTCPALHAEESDVTQVNEKEDDKKIVTDPSKDRTKVLPPETSIRYMKSEAYKITYGSDEVWVKYRRNFKGSIVPRKTRRTCIRGGVIATGNPCPICRDEYLVLHYTNVDLLKQFISPETGEIYDVRKTHICQVKLLELEVAVSKAKSYGYLTDEVPFRKYDYSEYYPEWKG